MDNDIALAAERLDHPLGKHPAKADLGLRHAHHIVGAHRAERRVAGGERDDRDAGVRRLPHHPELGDAGIGEDHDHVEILCDQAADVSDLLLRLELAVRVADFLDVRALGGLVLELGTRDLTPVIAAPAISIGDPDLLGAAILGNVLHVLDTALLVWRHIEFGELFWASAGVATTV